MNECSYAAVKLMAAIFFKSEGYNPCMSHPFEKLLEKALARSHGDENAVLGEAERLMEEGYKPEEIYGVLKKMRTSHISEFDEAILDEAVEEFGQYVDEE